MVRLTTWLSRVPVIRFPKGNAGRAAAPAAAKGGSCPVGAAPAASAQPAAAMSTGAAIPDIDLPARYRRQPLSDEEIDHINGGGIHDPLKPKQPPDPQLLGVLKIPKGVIVQTGKRKEVMGLNITLQKSGRKTK